MGGNPLLASDAERILLPVLVCLRASSGHKDQAEETF
jgi:hypothetical protein